VTGPPGAAEWHVDAATLASLGARERSLLVHVATCVPCRRRLAATDRDEQMAWRPDPPDAEADLAILRLYKELESGGFEARIEALERERSEAIERVAELLAHPDSWGTAASEPRYATMEVAWRLLEAARDEEPALALRLINLAGEIAIVLTAQAPGRSLTWQLMIEVRCARADRLLDAVDWSAAARELRRAAGLLRPDLGYGRALFCRTLARLRRAQRRWEEALGLADRAVALLDDHGSTVEAGQAQVEQGWTLIEAGDPDEALPLLEAALPLVDGEPPWAVTCRLGLAVVLAEHGDREGARGLLAAADRLAAEVTPPAARLRLRWGGAQAARRCGEHDWALRRLLRVVPGLLAAGEDHAAAAALLELLALCLERRWQRALGMAVIEAALDSLVESPQLHRRARSVLGLVAYALADPGARCAAEVIAGAGRYLVASRHRPELRFQPLRSVPLVHLAWDDIEPRIRASMCVEVGAEEAAGRRPGNEIDAALRDLISWRLEVLRRVRIEFPASCQRQPPAA
jgi:tetratricopeptide (TPR) repeat protein